MSEMLKEAAEAPDLIRAFMSADQNLYSALGERLRKLEATVVGTLARGSSDHVANYAGTLIPLCTGKVVSSLTPSLVTVLQASWDLKKQFVLAISQGGGSPDLLAALQSAKSKGALTVALVNEVESPLAKVAEVLLPQRAGKEKGLAATKSVLCSLAAIVRLVAEWSEDKKLLQALNELPKSLEAANARGLSMDASSFKGFEHIYVISRGLGLSVAQEAALKIKETLGLHAEAFSSSEVLHGPLEIVGKNFLILSIPLSGSGEEDVRSAAKTLAAQGAHILELPSVDVPDFRLAPIAALQILYPWLARAAETLGRHPDRPQHIKSKIIKTV